QSLRRPSARRSRSGRVPRFPPPPGGDAGEPEILVVSTRNRYRGFNRLSTIPPRERLPTRSLVKPLDRTRRSLTTLFESNSNHVFCQALRASQGEPDGHLRAAALAPGEIG